MEVVVAHGHLRATVPDYSSRRDSDQRRRRGETLRAGDWARAMALDFGQHGWFVAGPSPDGPMTAAA